LGLLFCMFVGLRFSGLIVFGFLLGLVISCFSLFVICGVYCLLIFWNFCYFGCLISDLLFWFGGRRSCCGLLD